MYVYVYIAFINISIYLYIYVTNIQVTSTREHVTRVCVTSSEDKAIIARTTLITLITLTALKVIRVSDPA